MKKVFLEGQMDVIDALLEQGFNVNSPIKGFLPLNLVCSKTEAWTIDVVTKLLDHGANVDLDDKYEGIAINYALSVIPFQPHVAQLLLDCSKMGVNHLDRYGYNYLWNANSGEAIKFLVENGIDFNHTVSHLDGHGYLTYLDVVGNNDNFNYLRTVGAKLYSEL